MAVSWSFLDYFWLCCQITVIRFWCHGTHRTLKWCGKTVENFIRTVRTGFEKIAKSSKRTVFWSFLDYFWLCCQITVIRFWCHCTHGTLKWCRMTVENFVRTTWRFFWKKIEGVHNWPFPGLFGATLLSFIKGIHSILMPLLIWDSNWL